ncbi:hypothetical protein PG985_008713 [Apiospora marii]|uniref:uncharacterized protein n=1 Tax=Apiospora marii TaxID=335849 RepID=UPI00312D7C8F
MSTLEASTELAHRISDTQPNTVMLSTAEASVHGLSSFGSEPNESDWETASNAARLKSMAFSVEPKGSF